MGGVMKCSARANGLLVLLAALVVGSAAAATAPGNEAQPQDGLPRMRDNRPAHLPARYRQDGHNYYYRKDRRHSPRQHSPHRSDRHDRHNRHHNAHHHRKSRKSSAHKSLKRFAASTKAPRQRPRRASSKSIYVLIKGKYSWPEAAHVCWKNGYELAALDSRNAASLVKRLGRGSDGIRTKDNAYWFGAYEKKRSGPYVLRSMSHRKPSIHRLKASADIRVPILCQLRYPTKTRDPFRFNDRRHYCDAPKTICVVGSKGPECQSHCALGVDKLRKHKTGSSSSSSSSTSSSSASSASHPSDSSSASSSSVTSSSSISSSSS